MRRPGSPPPGPPPAPAGPSQAVLDIGSNSIRIVAYSGTGRVPVPVFSERVTCGLGRALADSGRMDPEAVGAALKALGRWGALMRAMRPARVSAVATAAVREAANGAEFIVRARDALGGIPVEVVSGEQEARLSALGVVSATPGATGVVADFGGASLELARVSRGRIRETATLPLGSLRLFGQAGNDLGKAQRIADAELDRVGWLDRSARGRPVHLVGGLWRNLFWMRLEHVGYPLEVLHGYTVTPGEVAELPALVERIGADRLAAFRRVSADRIPHLPTGAMLLARLVARTRAASAVISGSGLREGLLFQGLPGREAAADPLLAGAEDMCRRFGGDPGNRMGVARWTDALFGKAGLGETPGQRRLRVASCLLSEVSGHAHPDHRADVVFREILYSHLTGIDHPGRVFLACAGHCRHGGDGLSGGVGSVGRVLDAEGMRLAVCVGLALRLAHAVGAGMADIVARTGLALRGGRLELSIPREDAAIDGEQVRKCLARLAESVGAQPRTTVGA